MSDETTLLPCPFCGGEARMLGTKERWFNPACSNAECGCEWTDSYATEAEAVAAWNARAERTCKRVWTGAEMICSSCAYQLNDKTANYCRNCGAKVVGE